MIIDNQSISEDQATSKDGAAALTESISSLFEEAAHNITAQLPMWLRDTADINAATDREVVGELVDRPLPSNVLKVNFRKRNAGRLCDKHVAEIEALVCDRATRRRLFDYENHAPILEAALRLAARGFRVTSAHRPHELAGCSSQLWRFPKRIPTDYVAPSYEGQKGKRPVAHGWQDIATSDFAKVVDQFLFAHLRAKDGSSWVKKIEHLTNISMVTGPLSGVFVVDVDGDDGMRRLAELEAEHGALPLTIRSRSGSGKGVHIIFRLPSGTELYNSANQFGGLGSKIDIRGENGQIIVPPSLHASGGHYAWEPGCSPDDVVIADAPAWVIRLAKDASKKDKERTTKERAERTRTRASGVVPNSVKEVAGFENFLATFGDGPGLGGFHGPIWSACLSYFSSNGPDADRVYLKDRLIEAIEEALADDKRSNPVSHYLQDCVLDGEIENAAEWIERERLEEERNFDEVRECLLTLKGADSKTITTAVEKVVTLVNNKVDREKMLKDISTKSGTSLPIVREIAKEFAKKIRSDGDGKAKEASQMQSGWMGGLEKNDGWLFYVDSNDAVQLICGVITPIGRKRNAKGSATGAVVTFPHSSTGRTVEVSYDAKSLTGERHVVIAEMADAGLMLKHTKQAFSRMQELLGDIINDDSIPPIVEAFQPGYQDDLEIFVLPNGGVIGEPVTDDAVRLAPMGTIKNLNPMGSEEVSRDVVDAAAGLMTTHPHFMGGVLAGFGGLVIQASNYQSGGITWVGNSGTGKSTCQGVQVSMWGDPIPAKGLRHELDGTLNAVEGWCRIATGTTLAADEVKRVKSLDDLEALPFKFTGEVTRARMNYKRTGNEEGFNWKVFVTLSSEKRYRELLAAKGIKAVAGAVRRFPEVSVVQREKIKAGTDDATKLARIKAHEGNYGHLGPVFARAFVNEGWFKPGGGGALAAALDVIRDRLVEGGNEDMVSAAEKFAVLEWVGEALKRYGILAREHDTQACVEALWQNFAGSNEAQALVGAATSVETFISNVSIGMSTGKIMSVSESPNHWHDLDGAYDEDAGVVYIFRDRFNALAGGEHGYMAVLAQLEADRALIRPKEAGRFLHKFIPGMQKSEGAASKIVHYRFDLTAFRDDNNAEENARMETKKRWREKRDIGAMAADASDDIKAQARKGRGARF
jgi:hypothetical protein